jgi:F-type H+-transporting ATPase subunit delta
LLGLAVDYNKVDEVNRDFDFITETLKHRELASMFRSPVITSDKKAAVVEALYKGKVSDLSLKYLNLLINKGREPYLAEIAHEYKEICLRFKHITDIKVISAAPLTEAVLAELKEKLTKSSVTDETVQITNVVDESIVGGFILEFDDKRYDASIKSKLDELHRDFSKNLYIKEF